MRPATVAALLCTPFAACQPVSRIDPGTLPSSVGVPLLSPRTVGAIMLTGLDLPASGHAIGGHYQGSAFSVRQFSYQMTDVARSRWSSAARQRGEALLRGAGYRVEAVAAPSSDPQRLENVRYGLSGRVTELDVKTSGSSEPYQVESQVEVAWEVLDIASGGVIFGRNVRGGARVAGPIDSAVGMALDRALERLLADSLFLRTLAQPRAVAEVANRTWMRPLPDRDETIQLDLTDLNASPDSGAVERVAFGLVSLHGPGGSFYGTAFIITKDGLAITTSSVVRPARRGRLVRARFASGIERPIRVVRSRSGINVALLQVQCPELCPTVDWRAPESARVDAPVLVIGSSGDGILVGTGVMGGRWGMANGVTLSAPTAIPGEPVVAPSSGRVFAMVAGVPGRTSALLLDEVLRAVNVRVGAGLR